MNVFSWFDDFGALRLLLIAVAGGLVLLGPFSGGSVDFAGFALITTLVAPVAYAILVFVLPLDMTMTALFMTDTTPQRRAALKRALITEAVLLAVMIMTWLPFTLKLLRVR
ncbi:MAG: hypothetical protein ACI9DC_001580 [Gammaproteobacteria bacterium]|jgi:hypothetical protein